MDARQGKVLSGGREVAAMAREMALQGGLRDTAGGSWGGRKRDEMGDGGGGEADRGKEVMGEDKGKEVAGGGEEERTGRARQEDRTGRGCGVGRGVKGLG